MLKNRILFTLKFFDLQDYPLTLFELHKFLLPEMDELKLNIDANFEIINALKQPNLRVGMGEILESLEKECEGLVENYKGFFYLLNRQQIVKKRLENYLFAVKREKHIRKWVKVLRHIPYVRAAALSGSQAMGIPKENSDIDLLIITELKFMWLARTLVTAYFQIIGLRRYGSKIANRFCLNHYLAGAKKIDQLKNLYTAMEYIKLRQLVYSHKIYEFQNNNIGWIRQFFPHFSQKSEKEEAQSAVQKLLEKVLNNRFGNWLENFFKKTQLRRIQKEEFIIVRDDELSFHPQSRQKKLLDDFFSCDDFGTVDNKEAI
jgi:predicted nucleotidyltransferase